MLNLKPFFFFIFFASEFKKPKHFLLLESNYSLVKLSTSLGKRSNLAVPMKKKSKTSSIQVHHEGVDLPLLQPLPNYAVYESNAEEILFPLKRVMVRCFVKAPWHLVQHPLLLHKSQL